MNLLNPTSTGLTLWFLLIFLRSPDTYGATKHLTITIGESMDIILSGNDISASRKGVVDLFHAQGQTWVMTGLKRGFVLIKGEHHHYKVTVIDHTNESHPSDDLCQLTHADCQDHRIILKGVYQSLRSFFLEKSQCQDSPSCLFQGKLSPEASTELQTLLGETPDPLHEIMTLDRYCPADQNPLDSFPYWLQPFLHINCKSPQYQLEAQLISVAVSDLENIGLKDGTLIKQWIDPKPVSPTMVIDETTSANRQLTAIPAIAITAGEEAKIHTGGEFYVPAQGENEQGSWKKFGVQLTVNVTPKKESVLTAYTLQMNGRGQDISLNGNFTQSTVELTLDTDHLVARVPFYMMQAETQNSWFFQHIPLIGPLFGRRSQQREARELFVFFRIKSTQVRLKSR